ncbi:MAG: glycoside hydrolase family 2 protein [Fimbriimonadia bacterium]|nr:glycoside hydrolase family 2 protein [Fimbriimonadia bacterium]
MIDLNGVWRFQGFAQGSGLSEGAHLPAIGDEDWMQARVPGDLFADLEQNDVIEDPYYHDYVERCRWAEEREWWYRCSLRLPEHARADRWELVFSGIDTDAVIYWDGEPLGETHNMFREYRFDVTERLKGSDHHRKHLIAVCLSPIAERLEAMHEARKSEIPGFWSVFHEGRVWARKSQMHFGWDWAPRLVTAGLWRGVELRAYQAGCVRSLFAQTLSANPQRAILRVEAEFERFSLQSLRARFVLEPIEASTETDPITHVVDIEWQGDNGKARANIEVANPALWWTHDLGTPNLYRARVELLQDGQRIDTHETQIGIREIALQTEADGEKRFTFLLNGVPIFCKGANWIPADGRTGNISPARYAGLIRLAAEANLNMLRVWGGGIYEHEAFYDECDRQGILVWQDFMFSCATYPDHDPDFLSEVEAEARYQIGRLRSRACLAIWCGNNECQWLDDLFHWQDRERKVPGWRIYHEMLPELLATMDPNRPYIPGSPYGGDDHNDEREGDRHNWQVWGGQVYPRRFGQASQHDPSPSNVNFRRYAEDTSRFVSEYGIHGAPPMVTLKQTVPPSELYYDSPGFLNRIKDPDKNRKVEMMRAHTGLPNDLSQYVTLSMLTQAEGLKFGIEHFRRQKPHCSGSLFWQWNDSWSGISWSVLDYFMRPKASWHYVKRAYTPLIASLVWKENALEVWLVNDRLEPVKTNALLRVMDFNGKVQWQQAWQADAASNQSQLSLRIENPPLTALESLVAVVQSEGDAFPMNTLFFKEFKELALPKPIVEVRSQPVALPMCCYDFELRSDTYAHFVHLTVPAPEARWTDNYIELLPGETRTIRAVSPVPFAPDEVHVSYFLPNPE